MPRNKIPDFNLLPWRENRITGLMTDDKRLVGEYVEYINEQSGQIGLRVAVDMVRDPIFTWEESLISCGKEIRLRYVTYRHEDAWRIIRVKNNYPCRVTCEVSAEGMRIVLYFELVIKGEIDIEAWIRF